MVVKIEFLHKRVFTSLRDLSFTPEFPQVSVQLLHEDHSLSSQSIGTQLTKGAQANTLHGIIQKI